MAWPTPPNPGDLIASSLIGQIITSLSNWGGDVSAGGHALGSLSHIGIGINPSTIAAHVFGEGVTSTSYDVSGPHDATILLQSTDDAVASGGTILFGGPWGSGFFAGIKGHGTSGSNNSLGDIIFMTRAVDTNTYIQEMLRLTSYGRLYIAVNNWATGHLVIGAYHLWCDSLGKLRIKNGAPAFETDGTIVGTQS